MLKTINIPANTETTVTANKKYACAYIENQGTADIYASKNPSVVADADDVTKIQAGETKQLLCESDKVYLLSSEISKAEILFSDYLNLNFRKYLKGGEILKNALNLKADSTIVTTHTTNTNNPHAVTKTQVGLENVSNIDTSVTTNITDTSSKRFVSDTEKTSWNDTRRLLPVGIQGNIETNPWQSIAYGNGMFVAVSGGGTNRAAYSRDGVKWTPITVELSAWFSVAYGNGMFVAVAHVGTNRVMYSTNGINWTSVPVELGAWLSVTYGNGMFVAVAVGGTNRVMYSVNGVNWTPVTVGLSEWYSVAYGNGMFVAVATGGTNRVMYSTNGINWTPATVELNVWYSVAYGNGMFVAVATGGTNRVMYSTNGINWTSVPVQLSQWRFVTYGNGMFVAVAHIGTNRAMYSTNGVNWFYRNIPALLWYPIGYGDGMFVALAQDSAQGLLTFGERLYSDKSRITYKSIITDITTAILSTDWISDSGNYIRNVTTNIADDIVNMLTHQVKIVPVWSSDKTTAQAEMLAFSKISRVDIVANNTIRLTCYDDAPATNLNIILEIYRKW